MFCTGRSGARRGDRQNGGEQPDDRSCRREACPKALRGAGWASSGSLMVYRRFSWVRRRKSAGASFLRLDGTVWTTDKDGLVPALLTAEITARMGRDPGEIYRELTAEFGEPLYDRIETPTTPEQKEILKKLSTHQIASTVLAGEKIVSILTQSPGNNA
jgi:phosphoglucomutase